MAFAVNVKTVSSFHRRSIRTAELVEVFMAETWTTEKVRIWQFAMKSRDLPPAPDALASLIQSHLDANLQLSAIQKAFKEQAYPTDELRKAVLGINEATGTESRTCE